MWKILGGGGGWKTSSLLSQCVQTGERKVLKWAKN